MKTAPKDKSAGHLRAPVNATAAMSAIGPAIFVVLAPIAAVTMPDMWAAGE